MDITRKNHYVPQFYLKQWCNSHNKVFVRENITKDLKIQEWRELGVSKICYIKDLYTLHNSKSETDFFEKYLSTAFENKAGFVISKILKNKVLNNYELRILIDFILVQFLRTPTAYKNLSEVIEPSMRSSIKEILSEFHNNEGSKHEHESNTDPLGLSKFLNKTFKIEQNKNEISIKCSLTRSLYMLLCEDLFLNSTLTNRARAAKWHIQKSPLGYEFPTSDNPVVFVYKNSNNQLYAGNIFKSYQNFTGEIFFPLSPKYVIWTNIFKFTDPAPTMLEEHQTALIKNLIICNSHFYIISKSKIQNINNIFPRIINKEKYITKQKMEKHMGEVLAEIENGKKEASLVII